MSESLDHEKKGKKKKTKKKKKEKKKKIPPHVLDIGSPQLSDFLTGCIPLQASL